MRQIIKTSLFTLLALLLPVVAIAHDFKVDGIYYKINGNEAAVTYQGTSFDQYNNEYSGYITIPTTVTYGGIIYSVTSIDRLAFYNCFRLYSITIPISVTSIDDSAFYGCSGLSIIDIPNSVISIGTSAFYGTAWFNNQPDGLVYAGLVAYKYKGTMPTGTSITIAEGTLGIADYAFDNCNGLTSIYIPNSVTSIGESAFSYCTKLTSVNIPNLVTSIDYGTF